MTADRDQLAEQRRAMKTFYAMGLERAQAEFPSWLKSRDRAVRRAALLEAADAIETDLYEWFLRYEDGADLVSWLRARAEAGEL